MQHRVVTRGSTLQDSPKGIRMTKFVSMVVALALAAPMLCSAQDTQDPARLEISRAELVRLLGEYEGVAQSTAYSDVLREEGQAQADLIRERLTLGDFRAGGHIALLIESEGPAQWDTLTIEAGPAINVPTLGSIQLGGLLRSELEAHLTAEVGRFIQKPVVFAGALIRVAMVGVGRPGFHTMPADLPLSEAVMTAGGPVAGADPGRIQIERGEDVIWSVEELLGPVADGRTLDQLGLQGGDRIILTDEFAPAVGGVLGRVVRYSGYVLVPLLLRWIVY
jgi:hypothetical protein